MLLSAHLSLYVRMGVIYAGGFTTAWREGVSTEFEARRLISAPKYSDRISHVVYAECELILLPRAMAMLDAREQYRA